MAAKRRTHIDMYRILFFFIISLSRFPLAILYLLSDMLYYPVYYVFKYRRKVVRRNLTESFPQKSLKEIKAIEKKFYRYFVDMVFETIKTYTISEDEMHRRAEFVNAELLNNFVRQGRSVAVYIGHYCNWEWISSSDLWFDKTTEVVQIYHPLNNHLVNDFMVRMRSRFGGVCVEMDNTVRYVLRQLKAGKNISIGFIGDQSPRRKDSKYFIDFLNHYVPVLTGPEKVIKLFGLATLFLRAERIKRGYYRYTFTLLAEDTKKIPDFQLTDLYFQKLEQEILRNPEYYLWTHKRFRYAMTPEERQEDLKKKEEEAAQKQKILAEKQKNATNQPKG